MITISERREHESAKSFVLRVLIDNIINTRLEPGEKLNEPELCEQLGVSRTPFREAELELARRDLQSMELQFQQGKASQNQLTTQQYDLQNKELAMKTADLNLFQTMETYDWAVKCLASAA